MNLNGLWRENYPMAKLSTWRVGGPARCFVYAGRYGRFALFFA